MSLIINQKLNKFIKKFNVKYFGINYDTGNSTNLNYKFEDEMINFRYIKNIHLKDRKINGFSKRLGKGDIILKKLLASLKKINIRGNIFFNLMFQLAKIHIKNSKLI